jgi:hypothetical protein
MHRLAHFAATTAHNALGDKRLYKFRSTADETQMSRLKSILCEHRIRFSRPSELNDPIEGRPIYELGPWQSEEYRKVFEEWAWNTQQRFDPRPPKEKFTSWIRSLPKEYHEAQVRRINSDNHTTIEAKWRVLSLSAAPANELMWSHYADGHRGVTLIFDASVGEFGLAFKVHYVEERAPVDITTGSLADVLNATLLTKRSAWAYEQEFRCIAPEPPEPQTLRLDRQFMEFPPNRLKGVIFGVKTPSSQVAEIVRFCTNRVSALQFWRATIADAGHVEIVPYNA